MKLFILCKSLLIDKELQAKTLRIMRLMTATLLIGCLHVSAGVLSQNVNLSLQKAPLEKVFSELHKQTGYAFFYDLKEINSAKAVTIEVKDKSLEEVLQLCLRDQPVTYTIVGKTVVIKPVSRLVQPGDSSSGLPADPLPPQRPGDITGRVINEQLEPLSGTSIIIKRTGRGTIADAKGNFKLSNVNPDDYIEASFTGYKSRTVKVGQQSDFTIVLAVAVDELDRAIVQGYGKTTARLATGNIAKVTAEEIERQPVMNPLLALQGRVPGLNVIQTSGFASAPVKVELRGRAAIDPQFTSDPLYIIDGVPLTVLEIRGSSSYRTGSTGFIQTEVNGPAGGQSPLFSLNPSDIESIEVLKDADATAIYGSRGAKGVILITTKKGKPGKAKFDLNITEGISKATRYYDALNTAQYVAVRKEAFKNDGITMTTNNAWDLLSWDTTRYTDWQRALYGGTAHSTNVQGGFSVGDTYNQLRVGAGYGHAANILTVSGADQKANISLAVSHHSLDQRFSLGITAGYGVTKSDMISLPGNFRMAPNAPAIFDSLGQLNYSGWGGQNSGARRSYPFSGLKRPYISKTNFLNSSLQIGYQLMKGLSLSASAGYNNTQANQQNFTLIASQDPLNQPKGSSFFGYNTIKNWIIESKADYSTFIGKGRLGVLIGASAQYTNTSATSVNALGYTSDDLIKSISNAETYSASDAYGEYRYAALFASLTYAWSNKYSLHLSGRRDGSSRFGEGKQYGNFGAAGAAWIFSEEKWFRRLSKVITYGKIRTSYGVTGSDGVGDYQYLTRWGSNGDPYTGIPSIAPQQHANPNFQWQASKTLEGAIDLGFIKDRVLISVTCYRTRVGNQLISFPIASFTGFGTVTENSPALVQNIGWEFTANLKVIQTRDFDASINFNLGLNKNKLVAYPDFQRSPYVGQLEVGKPLNLVRKLHAIGVDPLTGHYIFEDKNHDGKISFAPTEISDDSYFFKTDPSYSGGAGVNFRYKKLSVNLFFNFVKQKAPTGINYTNLPGTISNQPVEVLSRWQKPGDIKSIASFTTQPSDSYQNYGASSDGPYVDASYIRLNNLSLSYVFPVSWTKKVGMQGCSLFLNAANLFVITPYPGIDPGTPNFGSLPPSKTIVGGIHFSF